LNPQSETGHRGQVADRPSFSSPLSGPNSDKGELQRLGLDSLKMNRRGVPSLAVKAAELSFAVPEVVAHRMTRMALSGSKLSARDTREFERMMTEKGIAFADAWTAMAMQAARANQAVAASRFRSFLSVARGGTAYSTTSAAQLHKAALGVLSKGLSPVHRKAVANAKRLRRTRFR
jgi:hypothetical protein